MPVSCLLLAQTGHLAAPRRLGLSMSEKNNRPLLLPRESLQDYRAKNIKPQPNNTATE